MIKCIIFDFGNVLFRGDWEEASKAFEKEEGFSILFRGNRELEEIYEKVNIGKDSLKTLVFKLAPNRKDIEKIIKSYQHFYAKYQEKNIELYKLIKKLKKNYAVYCYTDTIKEHYEANKENGHFKLFKKVFTSFDLNKRKQHENAFQELLKIIPFKAEECIFIDDHPKNIENAKAAGFHTIHYTQFPDIRPIEEKLKELKLILS